jgi:hypothetical protein
MPTSEYIMLPTAHGRTLVNSSCLLGPATCMFYLGPLIRLFDTRSDVVPCHSLRHSGKTCFFGRPTN